MVSISRCTARRSSKATLANNGWGGYPAPPFPSRGLGSRRGLLLFGAPGCNTLRNGGPRERADRSAEIPISSTNKSAIRQRSRRCFITRQPPEKLAGTGARAAGYASQSSGFSLAMLMVARIRRLLKEIAASAIPNAKTSQGGMSIATVGAEFMQADQGGSPPNLVSIQGSKRPTRRPSELFSRSSPTPMGGQR
jgi:hypothetical protein